MTRLANPLVAGVDTSTQSCKVVVRDAGTGALVRSGAAPHPAGTEVDPAAWEQALTTAIGRAGGLDGVAAVSVGGQQHGMVALDGDGAVVRPALLWNDQRSAGAARDLVTELGGPDVWAREVGIVPVASFTVTKLRWLARHEPANADRVAAVCLPHDWVTSRLRAGLGAPPAAITTLTTDRSDVSGTGYWSSLTGYRDDLLQLAFGRRPVLPRVLGPAEGAGRTADGLLLGPGAGDNAAAALALDARPGDVIVSLGTSGVASAVVPAQTVDPSGTVAGFSDARGAFLPLVATVNGAQVLDAIAGLLGVDHAGLAELALAAPSGCGGMVLVPYLEGERTPNRPDATGSLHGMRAHTMTPSYLARAAVEGLLCGLADAIDALRGVGAEVNRVFLVGGAAASAAVREIAPRVLGCPVDVPEPGELVADGAARQAAWVLSGEAEPPAWGRGPTTRYEAEPDPALRARYAQARDLTIARLA